uniref:DUF2281 domain-containing protein n=1 Tax=candidate division WOR-3 bacterium TaxID=2052148 RepID=A0A7C4TB67_UNCW3
MPKILLELSEDEIVRLILQLPAENQRAILNRLAEKSEVWELMKLSESSFAFWEDPAEDIYEV